MAATELDSNIQKALKTGEVNGDTLKLEVTGKSHPSTHLFVEVNGDRFKAREFEERDP